MIARKTETTRQRWRERDRQKEMEKKSTDVRTDTGELVRLRRQL
jgi:hypothetical protein